MATPEIPETAPAERGRPLWALLGLLTAVSIAVVIVSMGFSAA